MHEVVVVAVDGSAGGFTAVAEAAEIASRFRTELIAVSVDEGLPGYAGGAATVPDVESERDRYFAEVGAEAGRIAAGRGAHLRHEVRTGHAADTIVRFAEEVGADLVVMGYKGHSRVEQFMIGTTAQKVNAYSRASVLIVKPHGPAADVWDGSRHL
jgi:nucleotide-binding universal stress UspA family protein